MHELGITRSILEICAERAAGARVCRVTVEVGTLTCVRPEALRFCFEACAEGTALAGAELEIVTVPGRARCRGCGLEAARDDLLSACECGSFDLEHTAGEDLRIREMEVREPPIALD